MEPDCDKTDWIQVPAIFVMKKDTDHNMTYYMYLRILVTTCISVLLFAGIV